jgi:hypothetical protein
MEARQTSKLQYRRSTFVWCWTVPALCKNPFSQLIKYYSLWVHVSSQLYLLDGYFIIPKYNELNHLHRAQININADKNVIHWLLFSFQTIISLHNIWWYAYNTNAYDHFQSCFIISGYTQIIAKSPSPSTPHSMLFMHTKVTMLTAVL